jgi:cell division protein FtsN
MTANRRGDEPGRELRLEGLGLVVVGGVLLAAIGGAFHLGKWVERRAHPSRSTAVTGGQGPLSQVVPPTSFDDAEKDQSFFDELGGNQKEVEPDRELRPDPEPSLEDDPPGSPGAAPAGPSEPLGPATATDPGGQGDYFVQVFAGRDRSSAESLVGKLKTEGYVVRVFSEREGQGLLFKVRVGGYPSKDRAQRIASSLKQSGYSAWVPPLE